MPFISRKFVVFVAAVAAGYFVLPARYRWLWLLAASLVFYALAGPLFLLQILAATAVAFVLGQRIEAAPDKARKLKLLWLGVALIAANLIVMKYTGFFNESLRGLFALAGAPYPVPALRWALPLGISFYTFSLISYLVDIFRGQMKAERHAGLFALYALFFAKVISGPIERAKTLLPQLHAMAGFNAAMVTAGAQLILWGVFKKVFIADRIAPFVAAVYDAPAGADGVQIAFASWLYAFQLYADFSGYTDMARGIAMLFGFKLMENFNRPYFAVSIQDFWKRWHMSLTSWLNDYVFTPITRQRTFKIKFFTLMLYGMMITFVVSGFWHGAAWTFVLWGALHGGYIVVSLLLQKPWNNFARAIKLTEAPNAYRALKIAVTFTLVCFAYLLFRAQSVADSLLMMARLPSGWDHAPQSVAHVIGANQASFALALLGIGVLMGADLLSGRVDLNQALAKRPALGWGLAYAGALTVILLGAFGGGAQFIYFQF